MKLNSDSISFLLDMVKGLPADHGFEVVIAARWAWDSTEVVTMIRQLKATGMVKSIDKQYGNDSAVVNVHMSNGMIIPLYTNRDNVCKRIQVGTRTVEVPDPDAPKITIEEPVFEWECGPILADDDD